MSAIRHTVEGGIYDVPLWTATFDLKRHYFSGRAISLAFHFGELFDNRPLCIGFSCRAIAISSFAARTRTDDLVRVT